MLLPGSKFLRVVLRLLAELEDDVGVTLTTVIALRPVATDESRQVGDARCHGFRAFALVASLLGVQLEDSYDREHAQTYPGDNDVSHLVQSPTASISVL